MRRRILLLVSLTLSITLLAITLAEANHVMYVPGNNVYLDSGLMSCSTQEESLKVMEGIITVEYLTYGVARKITEANNCVFYRDPVSFTISEMLCRASREDGRIFTIAKAIVEGGEKKFAVIFTDSKAYHCGV